MISRMLRNHLWIAIAFWVALGGLRLISAWKDFRPVPVMLAAQSGLITWYLLTRGRGSRDVPWSQRLVAWISALLPLGMRLPGESLAGQLITCLGLLLVLWAMETLGRSFGIAPRDRGLVRHGPYRLIRHPMYLGELVSLAGGVVNNLSVGNMVLFQVILLSLLLRIHWEERILGGYGHYAGQVPWRLIPGIW